MTDSWQMRAWRQRDTLMYRATIITLMDALRDAAEEGHAGHLYGPPWTLDECRREACFRRAGLLRSLSSFNEEEK